MATSPNLHPPSVAASKTRPRSPLRTLAIKCPSDTPPIICLSRRTACRRSRTVSRALALSTTSYSSPIYSADFLSLINPRLGAKNSARTTGQSEYRHNRPTRNSPRHQHRQIHRRFSKSKRPLPACGRPARDQRNFQIKIRKAPPLRHKEANSTQPASRKPTSESLFTQFSESRVTIMASRSE